MDEVVASVPAMPETLRTEVEDGVGSIVLTRADEYNTITPALRNELAAAIDQHDADNNVRVILLRAEGPAFCAGYGLDWSTAAQASAERAGAKRVWDSVADYRMISWFVDVYMKLWYASKPTIAAVQGWCIAGGTDMVLCSDLIVAGESAVFGYPPARVWGTPTTAMWVYRMGLEQAKRYLLTGDEIPAPEAARIGLILEAVPDGELDARSTALAERMAAGADESTPDAQAAMQSHGREYGVGNVAAGRFAVRRNRTAHAGRPRFRRTSASGRIPAGSARARRSIRRLWLRASVEESSDEENREEENLI